MTQNQHEGVYLLAPVDPNGKCSTAVAVLVVGTKSTFEWIGGRRDEAFNRPANITSSKSMGKMPSPWGRDVALLQVPDTNPGDVGFKERLADLTSQLELSR